MTEQEAYQSLADFIKDYIYEKDWDHLNSMQIQAIEAIQRKQNNLLFTAGTAMGKTEAALMPTITELYHHPVSSVGIVYISPLKALINDQFLRIEEMLAGTGITITKWHGDALTSQKERLLYRPNGILQITPESLEAMLCRHPENVNILFSGTKYVIIDEIHYFMSSERGLQLLAVLERLQKVTNNIPIRLGLSATIKDTAKALDFLNTGTKRSGEVIENVEEKHHYKVSVTVTETVDDINEDYVNKVFTQGFGKRALLFTNSRRDCEIMVAALKKIAYDNGYPDVYYVHHGSISKEIREETEQIMKVVDGPVLTATTLTLELGIDIGDLDEVIQASQPLSISSMVQRVGRSGRRTGNSEIAFQLLFRIDSKTDLESIDLSLIRTIAMIELYFRERYMEEIPQSNYPFHLVIHEILAILCQKGCLYPPQLAAEVLELTIFRNISQAELRSILKIMIAKDLLMVYEDGAIGLGDEGERISGRMDFYAVFETGETFSVRYQDKEIGMVEKAYKKGDSFFLAGKSWKVIGCDLNRKRIDVEVSYQKADIHFTGSGMIQTDAVIMKKMHEILSKDQLYSYLDEEAVDALQDLRETADKNHLCELLWEEENTDNLLLFPELATPTINTLYYMFRTVRISCERISLRGILYGIRLNALNQKKFVQKLHNLVNQDFRIDQELLLTNEKIAGKYESLLSDELRYKELLADRMDVEGAKRFLLSIQETYAYKSSEEDMKC